MIQKKVLILGSYPIKNPQHGGQKRTKAIVEAYQKNFSKVQYTAIYPSQYYSDHSLTDIAVSSPTIKKINKIPNFSDIYCGEAIYIDLAVKRKLEGLIIKFKPDIIDIEQPYVYLGLRQLLHELSVSPKLIYSSHNIEFHMKVPIFTDLDIAEEEKQQAIRKIQELEKDLSQNSDMVIAVSDEDAAEYKKLGAKKVVIAPNGIDRLYPNSNNSPTRAHLKEGAYIVTKKILFIGSAHPPNWIGFEKMVSLKLGFLPTYARIYIAGGVSDYLMKTINSHSIEDLTFWQRAIACGRVSEKKLNNLLTDTDVIILPITEGGGSNLKTAEAFIANKKIVATSYAMRAYEYLASMPNLFIADKPEDFRKAIVEALDAKFISRSTEEDKLVQKVLWENCLEHMMQEVAKL